MWLLRLTKPPARTSRRRTAQSGAILLLLQEAHVDNEDTRNLETETDYDANAPRLRSEGGRYAGLVMTPSLYNTFQNGGVRWLCRDDEMQQADSQPCDGGTWILACLQLDAAAYLLH